MPPTEGGFRPLEPSPLVSAIVLEAHRRSLELAFIALPAASVSVIATVASTVHGPGLTPDSADYIAAGESLGDGSLEELSGRPLTIFPPGFPVLIALGRMLGMSGETTARGLGIISFAALVVLTCVTLSRHVRSRLLIAMGTFAIALSPVLLHISVMAWTDAPFIACCLVAILSLQRVGVEGARRGLLIAFSASVVAAFSLRYSGLFLLPIGAVATYVLRLRSGKLKSAKEAAWVFGAASLAPAAWMLRNRFTDGTLLGPRYSSIETTRSVATGLRDTLREWVDLDAPSAFLALSPGLAALVLSAVVLALSAARFPRASDNAPGASLIPLFIFVPAYVAHVALSALTTNIDPVDSRLLSPILIPVVVLIAVAGDRLWSLMPFRRWLLPVPLVLGLAIVTAEGTSLVTRVKDSRADGIGFNANRWQSSRLVEEVAKAGDKPLFSNVPGVLWAAAGKRPVAPPAVQTHYRSDSPGNRLEPFVNEVRCHGALLIWFGPENEGGMFTPLQLGSYLRVTALARTAQGTSYELSALPDDEPCRPVNYIPDRF